MNYQELTLQVCQIARTTGNFMAEERKTFDDSKIEVKGVHDLVSYVDKTAEIRIIEALQNLLPDAGFIAEEGTNNKRGERYNWVIDPLDGTTNYIHGLPIYSVSIALLDNNELVVGVVYEVGHDECFFAWKGGGAFLNGKSISVSTRCEIGNALLATGFPYSDFSRLDSYVKMFKWAMTSARGVRRLGSAAADLAYVACGRFDAFWEYDLKPWDVAAGALIVTEAGGKVTDYKGGSEYLYGKEIVATNGIIELPL
ncbi:MAG: inositol monophosphatase family protein [Paludibacter sp.]